MKERILWSLGQGKHLVGTYYDETLGRSEYSDMMPYQYKDMVLRDAYLNELIK